MIIVFGHRIIWTGILLLIICQLNHCEAYPLRIQSSKQLQKKKQDNALNYYNRLSCVDKLSLSDVQTNIHTQDTETESNQKDLDVLKAKIEDKSSLLISGKANINMRIHYLNLRKIERIDIADDSYVKFHISFKNRKKSSSYLGLLIPDTFGPAFTLYSWTSDNENCDGTYHLSFLKESLLPSVRYSLKLILKDVHGSGFWKDKNFKCSGTIGKIKLSKQKSYDLAAVYAIMQNQHVLCNTKIKVSGRGLTLNPVCDDKDAKNKEILIKFDMEEVSNKILSSNLPMCNYNNKPNTNGDWVPSKKMLSKTSKTDIDKNIQNDGHIYYPSRSGNSELYVKDAFIWQPSNCKLRYISSNELRSQLKRLKIKHFLIVGDSRDRGVYYELIEQLLDHNQATISKPPPLVAQGYDAEFDSHGLSTNSAANIKVSLIRTWGEMKDKDLRSCFNLYGDLSGLDWYVKGRQALEGIRNMEATLNKYGDDVNFILWSSGLHNARCSISDEEYKSYITKEALIIKYWRDAAPKGVTRIAKYHESPGVVFRNGLCAGNERLVELNIMAEKIVNELLGEQTYIGKGIFDMTITRNDRSYDESRHFYPTAWYKHKWNAFPRTVSSEIWLLLLNEIMEINLKNDDKSRSTPNGMWKCQIKIKGKHVIHDDMKNTSIRLHETYSSCATYCSNQLSFYMDDTNYKYGDVSTNDLSNLVMQEFGVKSECVVVNV